MKTKNKTKNCGITQMSRSADVSRFRSVGCVAANRSGSGSWTEDGYIDMEPPHFLCGAYEQLRRRRVIVGSPRTADACGQAAEECQLEEGRSTHRAPCS